MKNIKKRKIQIIVIVLVMVCLCFILFLQYSISKSILGETKVKYIVDINKVQEVQLAQQDFTAEKMLSKRDKLRLFQILYSTRKYNKKKDKSYLLDGYFLFSPKIRLCYGKDYSWYKDGFIYWEYKTGVMYYYYFSMEERKVKGEKYYLEEDKAAKLKELFEKYINLQGVERQ